MYVFVYEFVPGIYPIIATINSIFLFNFFPLPFILHPLTYGFTMSVYPGTGLQYLFSFDLIFLNECY